MSATRNTLYVSCLRQKVIFRMCLESQISDGQWEDCTDDYRPWMLDWNEIQVATDTRGRNFYAPRTYPFGSRSMHEAIGDEMAAKIRVLAHWPKGLDALMRGEINEYDFPETVAGFDKLIANSNNPDGGYSYSKAERVLQLGLTREIVYEAEIDPRYDASWFMWDCQQIGKAHKQFVFEQPSDVIENPVFELPGKYPKNWHLPKVEEPKVTLEEKVASFEQEALGNCVHLSFGMPDQSQVVASVAYEGFEPRLEETMDFLSFLSRMEPFYKDLRIRVENDRLTALFTLK